MSEYTYLIKDKEVAQNQFLYARELGDIVASCEKSLDKLKVEADDGSSIVRTFIGAYHAIKKKLSDNCVFDSKQSGQLASRVVSTYYASNAVLNMLNSDLVQMLRATDKNPYTDPGLSLDDVDLKADRSFMVNVLQKLKIKADRSEESTLAYNAFIFFEYLKSVARYNLTSQATPAIQKIFSDIEISGESYCFKDVQRKKPAQYTGNGNGNSNGENGKQKSAALLDNQLPTELPKYDLDPVSLQSVVGNADLVEKLKRTIASLLCYDPEEKRNPMKGRYHENTLLFGQSGVGKNYTVDAVLNWAEALAQESGKKLRIVNLRNLRSIYKDRSSQLLQHYYSLQKQDKSTIYINILDEIDGVLAMGDDGKVSEEGTKLIADFKAIFGHGNKGDGHILTIAMSNSTDENAIEPAVRKRFHLEYVPGPQNPREFARIIYNESKAGSLSVNQIDWMQLGTLIHQYRQQGVMLTGSDCAAIVREVNYNSQAVDAEKIARMARNSASEIEKAIQDVFPAVTHSAYVLAIQEHVKTIIKADSHKLSNYASTDLTDVMEAVA